MSFAWISAVLKNQATQTQPAAAEQKFGLTASMDRLQKAKGTREEEKEELAKKDPEEQNMKKPAAAKGSGTSSATPSKQTSDKATVPKAKVQQKKVNKPVLKRPAAAKVPSPKGTNKTSKPFSAEKVKLLKIIPQKLKDKYKEGCGTCRWVKFCTISCWRKRGFVSV